MQHPGSKYLEQRVDAWQADVPLRRRCVRICTVDTKCSDMWREANGKNPPERLAKCRNCPIGAAHAGRMLVRGLRPARKWLLLSLSSPSGMRLVGGDICVSCWNRAREVLRGPQCKGKHTQKFIPPCHRGPSSFAAVARRSPSGASTPSTPFELVVAGLRDCTRQALFRLPRSTRSDSYSVQGELF